MNCTPDARVYEVGDLVTMATVISQPGSDPGGSSPQVGANAKHDAFRVGDLPTDYVVNVILDAAEAQSAFNARHGHAEWTADETMANIRAALTAKTNGSRTSTTFALRNRIVRQLYDEAATREEKER